MGSLIIDIEELYHRVFGVKPSYHVGIPKEEDEEYNQYKQYRKLVPYRKLSNMRNIGSAPIETKDAFGVDIWLPIEFYNLPNGIGENNRLKLHYATIKITGSATIIRTPLVERKGTVKELYNIEDYKISIRGFFIDKQYRSLPFEDLMSLKMLHETGQSFSIWNALTDIYLRDSSNPAFEQQQVIITSFELPESVGGKKSMYPFSMELESDNVFTLEIPE